MCQGGDMKNPTQLIMRVKYFNKSVLMQRLLNVVLSLK